VKSKKRNIIFSILLCLALIGGIFAGQYLFTKAAADEDDSLYELFGDGSKYPLLIATCIDGYGVASNAQGDIGDLYKQVNTSELSEQERARLFWSYLSLCAYGDMPTLSSYPQCTQIVNNINEAIASGQGGGLLPITQITAKDIKSVIHNDSVVNSHAWLKKAIAEPDKYLALAGISTGNTQGGKTIPDKLVTASTLTTAYVVTDKQDNYLFLPIEDEEFVKTVPVTYSGDNGTTWDTMPTNGWTVEKVINGNNSGYKFINADLNAPILIQFNPAGTDYQQTGMAYNDAQELYLSSLKLYKCVQCCGHHVNGSKTWPVGSHQRFAMVEIQANPLPYYARLNGDPVPVPGDTTLNFEIYRHAEDMLSTYNVQLFKYDYETGKPLQGAIFDVYERFDDKGEISTDQDGPVHIYEGGDPYQSYAGPDPVIWSDFRKINSLATNGNGYIEQTQNKNYHYEKTFCDGHPAPQFVAVPEEEEDEETGEITNESEIEAAKAQNIALANMWLEYYNACEGKANSSEYAGVHFHYLKDDVDKSVIEEVASSGGTEGETPDAGNTVSDTGETAFELSGCREDRDATYDKFIALRYSYTFKENTAREGYILHDTHNDDIPIEVITTDSSENGANSVFANEYSKDITINSNLGHEMPEKEIDNVEEDDSENQNSRAFSIFNATKLVETLTMEQDFVDLEILTYIANINTASLATDSNADDTDVELATKSQISDPDFVFIDEDEENGEIKESEIEFTVTDKALRFSFSTFAADDEDVSGQSGSFEVKYHAAFLKNSSGGSVDPGPDDNYSHCNDKDSEGNAWRVYNHRTEGEIHFNKRDLYLDEYALENGDSSLEGAVYGLFAAKQIVHPDGKTGIVFDSNNLVAVATTDRNGDGSFLAITESPGCVYDYSIGSIISVGVSNQTTNLYTKNVYIDDYTEDGTYKGARTERFYTNNESNNLNCWIGRPLFLGSYYIKELSRSEGYELSVDGKSELITNKDGDLSIVAPENNGEITIARSLYEEVQTPEPNELFLEIKSKGTGSTGYDIVLQNVPEGTKLYRKDITMRDQEYEVGTGEYEKKLLFNSDGSPKWKVADADNTYLKYNSDGTPMTVDVTINATASGFTKAKINSINTSIVQTVLKGEVSQDISGNDVYLDDIENNNLFTIPSDINTYVKWKVESALRSNGYSVPKSSYSSGGSTQYVYSGRYTAIYDRGIREGEVDTYGVSGVTPGAPASKTVYGSAVQALVIPKSSTLTNGDVILSVINFYVQNPWFNYGGIDQMREDASNYYFDVYATVYGNPRNFIVLGSDAVTDSIIYHAIEYVPNNTTKSPRWILVPYSNNPSDYSFGTYENYKAYSSGTVYTASATLITEAIADGVGNISSKLVKENVYFAKGETILDETGAKIQDYAWVEKTKAITAEAAYEVWTEIPVTYEDGNVIIHIDTDYIDQFGVAYDDYTEYLTLDFKAVTQEYYYTLTSDDMKALEQYNPYDWHLGEEVSFSSYLLTVQKARAKVYTNYAEQNFGNNSYIVLAELDYPHQNKVYEDDETRTAPKQVYERPIKQQIKIIKEILTNDDGSYTDDTYSAVHEENLSTNEYNNWLDKAPDWLANLIGGKIKDSSTSEISDFRFKVYLKSNLERLYRDNEGNIVWLDRNGNELIPEYEDMNGDGNYETFRWKTTTGDIIDFEEISVLSNDNGVVSSNVQKIYTKVEHDINSKTVGDNNNNTWSIYDNPQTGDIEHVGEKYGYSTSLFGQEGNAVIVNDSLYSYDDKNINVNKTDRLNKEQNIGYTRILESVDEVYSYDKFFAAIQVANTDKWDSDMVAGTQNYPGQNWFNTFDDQYQKEDKNTSYKPFQWIREKLFGSSFESASEYEAIHDNVNIENIKNTSDIAHKNAQASNAVRQFAIDWYLKDEVAKLLVNNGYDEDVAKDITIESDGSITIKEYAGKVNYSEEIYDMALYNALNKSYNYLKPFFDHDLDTIYSVVIDSDADGGSDNDITTLSANRYYNGSEKDYYYGVSAYLTYGTYVIVEQQPSDIGLGDFDNKHYKTDSPKEVSLPVVYENGTTEDLNQVYTYRSTDTPETLAGKHYIRFNEEWADNHTDDLRRYVIRAHSHDGDYEIFKYGLFVNKLTGTITYNSGNYHYKGFGITQETYDPLKDYYNNPLVDETVDGGNPNSHYFADDANGSIIAPRGNTYEADAIEKRYHYGSVSEHAGICDDTKTMTGNKTIYDGSYATTLVPWSVTEPVVSDKYIAEDFSGYVDVTFRNMFYTTKLRIEKLDSETGENILHDNAIFALYAASRYTTQDEVDKAVAAGAAANTKIGDVKFYAKDTFIQGTYEYLTAMGAENITSVKRIIGDNNNSYTGVVPAGTPVCLEAEQIILYDEIGAKTGNMTVYTTVNDVSMINEQDNNKSYYDQNTGYFVTPQPIGAGVYVLAELKAPTGYSRTKPIAIEVYSDGVTYYLNGNIEARVKATVYEE